MKVGTAPCSWGPAGARPPFGTMLDEMAEAGYAGTELGGLAGAPADPEALRDAFAHRNLTLIGSWTTAHLRDPRRHEADARAAVRLAHVLRSVGGPEAIVVIGDAPGHDPLRARRIGRRSETDRLDAAGATAIAGGVDRVAAAVHDATGLRCALHPHAATWVETPEEAAAVLDRCDSSRVGLCLDTGHWTLAGGDPVAALDTWADRLVHVHLKDVAPGVRDALGDDADLNALIGAGVFPELGRGAVNLPAFLSRLREVDYRGWQVVEQDVLPRRGRPLDSARRNRGYLASLVG